MSLITKELAAARTAVEELIQATATCGENWQVPRAPGKWSPSQIVEHVARAHEELAKDVSGNESKLPRLSRPKQFLARHLVFNRVIRTGRFPKGRAGAAMNPESGPETPDDGRQRLEVAWAVFERVGAEMAASSATASFGIFGTVSLGDLVRFQELHTRHHVKQMPSR